MVRPVVVDMLTRRLLSEQLAANPDGVLERIAEEHSVSTFEVVSSLPKEHRSILDGAFFAEVMQELTHWGEVLLIVHTPGIVLECKGALPPGTFGHGYYNLHGDGPIGGHVRADRCTHLAFVSRPFMGRPSRSVQFFDGAGEAIFKVFVRRNAQRQLLAAQVALFDALRDRLAAAA